MREARSGREEWRGGPLQEELWTATTPAVPGSARGQLVSDTQWGRKVATLDKASYMAAELMHLHVWGYLVR